MERKKRFKMYKSGKNWVIAPIVFFGLTAGLTAPDTVKADSVSNTSDSQTTTQSKTDSLANQQTVALKSSQSSAQDTAKTRVNTNLMATSQQSKAAAQDTTAKTSSSAKSSSAKSSTSVNSNNSQTKQTQLAAVPTNNNTVKDTKSSIPAAKTNTKTADNNQVQAKTIDNKVETNNTQKAAASNQTASSSQKINKAQQAQQHDDAVQIKQNGQWYLQNKETKKNYTGFQYIKDQNKTVYYNPESGAMVYGQQKIKNNWYYFDKVTGAMQFGYKWLNEQKKEVYYDPNKGNMVYGQQKINGHWQYFDTVTGAQVKAKYVWIANQKKEVYYDGSGNMVYGQQKIKGKWQFFDQVTGAQAKNKFVNIKNQNKTVYYDRLGNMVYGQQKIKGHWYNFDKVTGAMSRGITYIPGQHKLVYYNNNGQMQYGKHKIAGKTYNFDKVTGALKLHGQQKIAGHWYNFDRNGNPITGYVWIKNQKKEVYYNPNTAQMVYGQQKIKGKWQFFDTTTGAQAKNKYVWIKEQNKEVYYNRLGNMVYDQQKINGKWQYFDKVTGAQIKNKYIWIADQKKEVYYDRLGNMVYGQQKLYGKWQYFDKVTGAQAKNKYVWIKEQNKEVYYDKDGNMVYGQQKINGKWQYFDKVTGAQVKNSYLWIPEQKKEVYYDKDGNMVYGQQKLYGKWQYFNKVTGAQVKNNFQYIDDQHKLCYYDGLGNMVYGWQTINGQKYYFNTVTGALEPQNSEVAQYRDDVASQINHILSSQGKAQMDADWKGNQNNYQAFGLHDTAQLVAQGDLKNDEQSIEINLQNNQLMNGTAKAYQVTVSAPNKEQAAQQAAQKIVSMLGNDASNWKALGVGATIQDANNSKNWNTTVIFYNKDKQSNFVKKTSNVQYKITNVYNAPGVSATVKDGLTTGSMNPADLVNAGLTDTAKAVLTGIQGNTISSENLEALANTVGGMTKAFVGTTTYYDEAGNPYHYEYWLDGDQEAGKQQEVANDNKDVKFGDTVTLNYNATLVYGKASVTSNDESTKPSTEMTAQEVTDAFKNGTETGLRYDKVVVKPIEGMSEDMIRGVDISSYKSLEDAGVQFYDFNGNPASLVKVLHDAGVNYVRLRLWNDPYNADNENYGGGVCDAASELAIAKEAKQYGMKVMLDLQYSDFWADPGKQIVPKAWKDLSVSDIEQEVYQYTRKTLQDFKNAGVDVGMIQIGNEITNGMLGQSTDRDHGGSYQGAWGDTMKAFNICNYLSAGSKAVRAVAPDTKITIQLETPNIDKYTFIMDTLAQHNVDYDVLGSSYYPFWSCADNNGHGLGTGANTPNNLLAVEKMVAEKYHKQFVVLETSWASTTQDADGTGNSIGDSNTKWQNTNAYPVGPQGQVDEIVDMYKQLVAGNGLGAFYWEPAWIPDKAGWVNWQYNDAMSEVFGTGWANSHSVGYSPDSVMYYQGKPAWGGTTWDNMAMFDDHGFPLQSLNVFNGMLHGYTSPDKINYAPLKDMTTTVTTPPVNTDNNDNSNNKPSTDPQEQATTQVQYKVVAIYNGPGVDNITVANPEKVGAIVTDMPSSVPGSFTGTKGDKVSTTDINKIYTAIPNENGVDGTNLQKSVEYPNGSGHYYYKYYIQPGFDIAKANENVEYGSPITVNVTATLTWTAE